MMNYRGDTFIRNYSAENDVISLHGYQNEVNDLNIKGEKDKTFLQVIVLN